nr:class I SAM-dependent methyltransferase [Solirubrobacterales bacterium]
IPYELRGAWTLIRRPDRPGLVDAIRSTPTLDLVRYDSDKSYAGQSWAFELIWAALRPGGVLVADDIGYQAAFRDFASRLHLDPLLVCGDGKLIGLARRPP